MRHRFNPQLVPTPFSDYPGGRVENATDKLQKGAPAKGEADREVKKWTRRISLTKVLEAHPERDC